MAKRNHWLRRAAWLLTLAVAAALQSARAQAAPCEELADAGARFTVCSFDVAKAELRLFWADASGKPYEHFGTLADALKARNERLTFAMNAGMFHPDFRPVGLYVENGRQIVAANTRSGPGNFHLKPNGIFYFGGRRAGVMDPIAPVCRHT